jgi:aspartate kinase
MNVDVFKLGGAFFSPKTVRNFFELFIANSEKLFVVSAVKGITRLLDIIVKIAIQKDIKDVFKEKLIDLSLDEFLRIHEELIYGLFDKTQAEDVLQDFRLNVFSMLRNTIFNRLKNDDQYYASVLKYGEIASSRILADYLNYLGIENLWLDARNYVLTDANYHQAKFVSIHSTFKNCFKKNEIIITQGFIGRSITGKDTLLGYDGSDLSAAVFAIALSKNYQVTLSYYKDVKGVYNGNPKESQDLKIFESLTPGEYILLVEETGSFVVRPDSIKLLAKAKVRVIIRSYLELDNSGTFIASSF